MNGEAIFFRFFQLTLELFDFFFKNKKQTSFDFSAIGIDMHSHFIPGIDDGAKTVEDSIQMIRGLQDLGYTKIITTPHIYADYYPNSKENILRGLEDLKKHLATLQIKIPIEASAEYYLDTHYEQLLESREILPLHNNYVLVEMSFFGAPPKLDAYLFKTQTRGYLPILAHPERYLFMKGDLNAYEALKDKGCLFQLNILSIMGYYGQNIAQTAKKLLKAGFIDLIGTDMHNSSHLEHLLKASKETEFLKILDKYGPFDNQKLLN